MTFWEYLDRIGARNATRETRFIPSDFRGWLAFGLFLQTVGLFVLMATEHALLESQGFMTLASAIIVTGWIGGAVAFAYAAGKERGEQTALANRALDLAHSAQTGTGNGEALAQPSGNPGDPVHVVEEEGHPPAHP